MWKTDLRLSGHRSFYQLASPHLVQANERCDVCVSGHETANEHAGPNAGERRDQLRTEQGKGHNGAHLLLLLLRSHRIAYVKKN